MKNSALVTFIAMILAQVGWAQTSSSKIEGTLSLTEAISQAEEKSPDLKRLRAAAERVSWSKNEALSGYLPHLTAGYDHFFNSTYMRESIYFGGANVSFPAAFPQDNITLDASFTVFDGFESLYKYRAANLNTEAADLDLSREKFKLEETVRLAYFQALAAQKLLEVARQNVKTLQEHLANAKLTERNGYGTQFDVLRIDATLAEAFAEQQAAEDHVSTSRDSLREAMGQEKEDPRLLTGELPVLQESDVPDKISLSTADRDDVKALTKRSEAFQELAMGSKAFWYPSISFFAEEQYYQFGNFDSAIQPNSSMQNASFLGVRLKWNIFDGGYSYAKQQEAANAAIEAQNQNKKVQIELPHEFDVWKKKFYYSVALYRARLHALALYQESVRLASIGVKAGTRTHTEMLDAELDLFRARGGLVKAQADAVEALGKLELAAGHKIWLASH
jgi:outer membrane protein TolC